MPNIHIQSAENQQTPGGDTIQVPSPGTLILRGPCLQVTVTLSAPMATQIASQGGTVPAPVSGLAMIDTGAMMTCIDDEAALQLGLPVIDVIAIASASHAETMQRVYPAHIEGFGGISIEAPRAVGAALASQGLIALIGRDILQHCCLYYNGPAGQFTLSV